MFLLDTNVISTLRRPEIAPPGLLAWAGATPITDLYLSVMSVYELELGVQRIERRDPGQGQVLRRWLSGQVMPRFRDRVLAIDDVIAARCAALQIADPRSERDSFIAATALVHRCILVTRNVRDFAPMGIDILNPWEG